MAKKTKVTSDFRYDTGKAMIPWAAVGEPVRDREIAEILRFLVPPAPGKDHEYRKAFQRLAGDLRNLAKVGQPAGKLTLGGRVKALEDQAAAMLKAKHAVFVCNATAGFEIAYKFAGLKPGDEVIAPAITFIATILYPLSIGAKVVLADVDPRTLNMDPGDVARKITPRTKVIFPVHLGGYPVDMKPLMQLAADRGITVIEDAAHAFGASYHGRMIGTIGDFGCFSFHEVKNVTALGEGGILVTNSDYGEQFGRCRFVGMDLSRQIPHWLYDVVALEGKGDCFAGGNYSATEIQAICLSSQLKRLERIIAKRKAATAYLNERLGAVPGIITPPMGDARVKPTYHLYLLQVDPAKTGGDVQLLRKKLKERGIVDVPHFAPLYKFSLMRQLGYDTQAIERTCPVAEEAFLHRFTHLPIYDFSRAQLKYLADAIIQSVRELGG